MQTDDAFRTLGRRRDLIDIEVRGVGGEDRARLGDGVELAEHLFLDVHVLEHRLDDEVRVRQGRQVQRPGQAAHAGLDLIHGQAAALGGRLVVLADDAKAPVEGGLRGLDDGHRETGVQEVHGDAAAHGSGADHADLGDRQDGGVLRHVGQLPHLTLGEEHVALGGGLDAGDQLQEQLALDLDAFVEGEVHRRLDALDIVFRRQEAAELAAIGLAEVSEDLRLAAGGLDLLVLVANFPQRALLGQHLGGEGDGGVAQVPFRRQLVDEAHGQRGFRRHMLAGGDHLQRLFRADDAGQTLRAARAGQEAKVHFRQADLGRRNRDAVVGAERDFQPAAQRRAVDRGDHGLWAVFHGALHVEEAGALLRGLAELGDVGARDEGAAFADQHDGLDRCVFRRGLEARREAVAHRRRQGVHRRRVEGEDGDLAALELGDLVDRFHGASPP